MRNLEARSLATCACRKRQLLVAQLHHHQLQIQLFPHQTWCTQQQQQHHYHQCGSDLSLCCFVMQPNQMLAVMPGDLLSDATPQSRVRKLCAASYIYSCIPRSLACCDPWQHGRTMQVLQQINSKQQCHCHLAHSLAMGAHHQVSCLLNRLKRDSGVNFSAKALAFRWVRICLAGSNLACLTFSHLCILAARQEM